MTRTRFIRLRVDPFTQFVWIFYKFNNCNLSVLDKTCLKKVSRLLAILYLRKSQGKMFIVKSRCDVMYVENVVDFFVTFNAKHTHLYFFRPSHPLL